MTGEEFWNLKRGATITVETPFSRYEKGQVLKVEYIDNLHQQIFLRDITKKLGDQVKIVSTLFMLEFFVIGGELPNKNNDKVLELPFKVSDEVWFIVDNEVHEGTLTECNVTINRDDTQICYNVLYYNRIRCKVEAKGIASNKLFKTKNRIISITMIDIKNIVGKHYQHTPTGEIKKVVSVDDNCVTLQNNSNYSRCLIKDFLKFWKPYYKVSDAFNDKVNHPSHYTWLKDLCGIEVIDITRHMDFNLGNSIKYILRSGYKKEEEYTNKDKTIEDLKKAIWYLNDEIKMLEKEN